MKFMRLAGSTAFVASLAACGGDGLSGAQLIGPGASLAEAETAFDELETRAVAVEIADGVTPFADLPTGAATYTGVISGGPGAGGSGDFDHYADLSLTTNFDTNNVTGSVTNFVTDVTDFENPTGSIDVAGTISDVGGDAAIDFSGSGPLVGDGVEADYDLLNADGDFVGTDGAVIVGAQDSDFVWTAGPDTGFTDASDGNWYAERD